MNTNRLSSLYQPIACASYESYEMAILRRNRLRIEYRVGDELRKEIVNPVDLKTDNGQEFLVVIHPDDNTSRIRLDQIVTAEVIK